MEMTLVRKVDAGRKQISENHRGGGGGGATKHLARSNSANSRSQAAPKVVQHSGKKRGRISDSPQSYDRGQGNGS